MTWVAAGVASAAVTIKGVQAYKASRDKKKAAKEQKELLKNRPQYEIPGQYQENVNQAKGVQAMYEPLTKTNQLPGQAYMQNRVDNNSANILAKAGMEGITSPSQYAQLLAATTQSQNDATTDLGIAGAQNRQANMGNFANATGTLMNANSDLANQEQFKWGQNTFSPYASLVDATTKRVRDYTQRQREREDSAIESGVSVGSMAGGGVSGMGGNGRTAEEKQQARFDKRVDRQNRRNPGWYEN